MAPALRPIAGVMGGADIRSQPVDTNHRARERAFSTRRVGSVTSQKLGLKTEAVGQVRTGCGHRAPVKGIERAIALLEEIGAGAPWARVDGLLSRAGRADDRSASARANCSGCSAEAIDRRVERILTGARDSRRRKTKAAGTCAAPTFRVDVAREIDLIEEVARHYGYDRLPVDLPGASKPPDASDAASLDRDRLVRSVLLRAGFTGGVDLLVHRCGAWRRMFADDADLVPIANPLSAKFSMLRPSLLPGLLDVGPAHNRHRQVRDVRLFELGSVITRPESERRSVALRLDRSRETDHWSADPCPSSFFDAKGVVADVARRRVQRRRSPSMNASNAVHIPVVRGRGRPSL